MLLYKKIYRFAVNINYCLTIFISNKKIQCLFTISLMIIQKDATNLC